MLRFRGAQMDAIDAKCREEFLHRATAIVLQWQLPRFAGANDASVAAWVAERLRRAEAFGLDDEATLLCWLDVIVDYGEAFAEDAYVVQMLHQPDAIDWWPLTRERVDQYAVSLSDAPDPRLEDDR